MGQVTSEDGDVARKAIQFYKIIRAFQNYFMDIERVSLGGIQSTITITDFLVVYKSSVILVKRPKIR